MKVGELFVNLGVKGAEKTVGALKSAKDGLNSIAETSIATKAAIAGVVYELGRLTNSSNQYGLNLDLFSRRTGISAQLLQKYEALMRHEGVTAEETMKSFEGLRDVIAQMATGEGVPKGFGAIADLLGPENFDPAKMRDFGYAMERIWMAAKKIGDQPDLRNRIFGGLNMGPNFLATLSTTRRQLSDIRPSEIYTDKELNTLSKMARGWTDLGNQIEKAIGRLNIQFGPSLLKDVQEILPVVLDLVKAFADLAKQLNIIKGIGKVFGWFGTVGHSLAETVKDVNKGGLRALNPLSDSQMEFLMKDLAGKALGPAPVPGKNVTNNVNTTVNVDSGPNAADISAKVGEIVGRKFNDAFRQVPQGGGI